MLQAVVIGIHVLLSLGLILLILLHSGRGGGLSDAFRRWNRRLHGRFHRG